MSKPEIEPRYPTGKAIEELNRLLNFTYADQDWQILNLDPNRLEEFLHLYEQHSLDDDQRFALMELIVNSYDEHLRLHPSEENEEFWRRIRCHLCKNFELHGYTVELEAMTDIIPNDDEPDTMHPVTPRMREIMHQFYGPRDNWPKRPTLVKRFCDWPTNMTPQTVLNSVEICDYRNGSGYFVSWSGLPGRPWGTRDFPTLGEAQTWAEKELGAIPTQWIISEGHSG